MAEHLRIYYVADDNCFLPDEPSYGTHVAVPVDEYDALIRARDILANPEQLAADIDHITAHVAVIRARYLADCLRRAAAGTADPDA